MNNYQLNEEIGKGNHSTIYKGRRKKTVHYYAISSIDKSKRKRVLNSVQILRSMNHPYVIQFHNWYETNNHLWVIAEFCPGGDMGSILGAERRLSEPAIRAYCTDLCVGLLLTHCRGIINNDIKPSNILMDSTSTLRYFDFGLACTFAAAAERQLIGTPLYMAPELFLAGAQATSMATDLWALGCLLYEMASGAPPFAAATVEEVIVRTLLDDPAPLTNVSAELNSFILSLLARDPLKRATWRSIAAAPLWEDAFPVTVTVPPEPAFAAFTNSFRGRSFSPEERRKAAALSAASARRNYSRTAQSDDVELMPHMETDFTYSHDVVPLPVAPGPGWTARHGQPKSEAGASHGRYDTAAAAGAPLAAAAVAAPVAAGSRSAPVSAGSGAGAAAASAPASAATARGGPANAAVTNMLTASHNPDMYAAGVAANQGRAPSIMRTAAAATAGASGLGGASGGAAVGALGRGSGTTGGERFELTTFTLEEIPFPEVVFHPSDAHIRPLCNNNRIERDPDPFFVRETLPFPVVSRAEIRAFSPEELTRYITTIYKPLSSSSTSVDDKQNILRFIECIASDSVTANVLVNSSVMTLCAKFASKSKYSVMFRTTAATVMGTLVRYTTLIHTDLGRAGIIPSLVALCSREEAAPLPVLKKLFVCLGELLFYVAAQTETNRALWQVNAEDVSTVYMFALESDDLPLQNYAAKAIENLASVPDKRLAAQAFAQPCVVEALLSIFASPESTGASDHLRTDAACAALKLAMINDALIPLVAKSRKLDVTGPLLRSAPVPRLTQVLVTFIVNMQLKVLAAMKNGYAQVWAGASSQPEYFTDVTLSSEAAAELLKQIEGASVSMATYLFEGNEQASPVVHGKAALFCCLLGCAAGARAPMSQVCASTEALATITRYAREPDPYLMRCVGVFVSLASLFIAEKLGQIAARVSSNTTPFFLRTMELTLNSALRDLIPVQPSAVRSLGECFEKAATSSLYAVYAEEFRSIAGGLIASPRIVAELHEPIFRHLLRPYAEQLRCAEGQERFSALCFLTEAILPVSGDSAIAAVPAVADGCVLVATRIAAAFDALVSAPSPTPTMALRLLAALTRWVPACSAPLTEEATAQALVGYAQRAGGTELRYCCDVLCGAMRASQGRDSGDLLWRCIIGAHLPQRLLDLLGGGTAAGGGDCGGAGAGGADNLVEAACELVASILEHVSCNPTSRTAIHCLAFFENRSLERIFLPLCAREVNGGGGGGAQCADAAATVVACAVRMTPAAQLELLHTNSVSAVTRALGEEEKGMLPSSVAVRLLGAVLYACEHQDRAECGRLGTLDPFMSALVSASSAARDHNVASLASRLVSLIKSS